MAGQGTKTGNLPNYKNQLTIMFHERIMMLNDQDRGSKMEILVFALFFIVAISIFILGLLGIIKQKTYYALGRTGGNIRTIKGPNARFLGIFYIILAIVITGIGISILMNLPQQIWLLCSPTDYERRNIFCYIRWSLGDCPPKILHLRLGITHMNYGV